MKIRSKIFIFLLMTCAVFANTKIQQLENKLKQATGKERLHVLANLSNAYIRKSPQKALEYAQQALQLAETLQDMGGKATSLMSLGSIYWHLSMYDNALEYYLESLKIIKDSKNKRAASVLLNNIGLVYDQLGDYDKALEYYQQSLEIKKELGEKRSLAVSLNNIGMIYEKQKNFPKALEHHQNALALFQELKDQVGISYALNNIGTVYDHLKQYDKALAFYLDSLKIKRKVGEKWSLAFTLTNIGELYIKRGKYDKALPYFNESLTLAKEINAADIIKNNYRNLSEYYNAKGNYQESLEYHKLYSSEKDKIFNAESRKKIGDMQARYEIETKENEIELLKKDQKIKELQVKRQKILRNSLIAIIVLILFLFGILFRKYLHLLFFWKKKNYIGHYKLVDKIATGGMGTIYKAQNVLDKTGTFALKVLKEELTRDENLKKRFKNEASIIDQLDHPNIVKIVERGEYDGNIYMAMELLSGQTLLDLLKKEKRLDLSVALNIMCQLADVLSKIHAKNIVHRDLKPENIMLIEKDGNPYFVKLLDFGIAKSQILTRLTQSGMLVGTLLYLSPEQVTDSGITVASDIFSLGIIFYEMLTGINPFSGGSSPVVTMSRILHEEPEQLGDIRPDLPGELTALITGMLNKKRENRPSIKEVHEAILRISR